MRLSASNLVAFIDQLPRDRLYNYVSRQNKGKIKITRIVRPEGPVYFKRFDTAKQQTLDTVPEESISTQMIWRIANAFSEGQPVNFDRILGGSYNTRSVLEALLAHTPEFYYCYPGRIEEAGSRKPSVKKGHKHLVWLPEMPHELGILQEFQTDIVISEIPSTQVYYDSLVVPDNLLEGDIDIDIQRRHAQIQIALILIGRQLNFRTWVAQNDKGIVYNNKPLVEMAGVVASLHEERIIDAFEDAYRAALLIDCIWFKNSKLMPAVMEIEHTTGVTSGLTRMKGLQDALPPFHTRYVIVAPDEDREKVVREANREQFRSLNCRYFPYSAVEELYSLCQRRRIRGVTEEFLDCYMEPVLQENALDIN